MSTPSSNMYFEAIHSASTPPTDPNLFTASEIVAGSFDSAAVSTATSKAVSTVNAAAPDSTSISQANSRAVSAASVGSVADSKAVSNSGVISIADSKTQSNSLNISKADSKGVSVAASVPVTTVVANSQNVSTADSKAVSVATSVNPLPASGRTTTTLSALLTNNAVFNVLDYAPVGVVINTGVNDATSAIQAAYAQADLVGGTTYFPPGTYKTSSNLIINGRWVGCGISTIIKPTNAVTICMDVRSGAFIDGFYLDGVNTSGKTGMDIGTALLTNIVTVQNCQIWRFAGVGGRGMEIKQLVTGNINNVYACANYINLHCNGGNTPTDTIFLNCQFRQATTKGVWLESGYALRFIKPLFESNGEEGLYIQNTGQTVSEITIDDAWYETNWQTLTYGANRHVKYHVFVDGANGPGGTIRFAHLCAKFHEDVNEARAIHLTNCTTYADFSTKCLSEAGHILIDGTLQNAKFTGWNSQNGIFTTTVTDSTGIFNAVFCAESHLIDNAEAAWTTWTPVVTGSGTMTIASLVITKARYKIIGKTMTVALTLSFTTGVAGGQTVNITLPTNTRAFDALVNAGCLIADGAFYSGYILPNGVNPTSSLQVGRADLANWSLGAGRQVNSVFTFELF